ncbi:MAG: hypothetical protein LBM38_03070 [Clostridiales bacterium]|jgi:hypothetical protein|nr:hypothetical protein [Clostridiales bacterium]
MINDSYYSSYSNEVIEQYVEKFHEIQKNQEQAFFAEVKQRIKDGETDLLYNFAKNFHFADAFLDELVKIQNIFRTSRTSEVLFEIYHYSKKISESFIDNAAAFNSNELLNGLIQNSGLSTSDIAKIAKHVKNVYPINKAFPLRADISSGKYSIDEALELIKKDNDLSYFINFDNYELTKQDIQKVIDTKNHFLIRSLISSTLPIPFRKLAQSFKALEPDSTGEPYTCKNLYHSFGMNCQKQLDHFYPFNEHQEKTLFPYCGLEVVTIKLEHKPTYQLIMDAIEHGGIMFGRKISTYIEKANLSEQELKNIVKFSEAFKEQNKNNSTETYNFFQYELEGVIRSANCTPEIFTDICAIKDQTSMFFTERIASHKLAEKFINANFTDEQKKIIKAADCDAISEFVAQAKAFSLKDNIDILDSKGTFSNLQITNIINRFLVKPDETLDLKKALILIKHCVKADSPLKELDINMEIDENDLLEIVKSLKSFHLKEQLSSHLKNAISTDEHLRELDKILKEADLSYLYSLANNPKMVHLIKQSTRQLIAGNTASKTPAPPAADQTPDIPPQTPPNTTPITTRKIV